MEFILAKGGENLTRFLIRQMVINTCEDVYWGKYQFDQTSERNKQIVKTYRQTIDLHALQVDPSQSPVQNHSPEQRQGITNFFRLHRKYDRYAEESQIQGLFYFVSYQRAKESSLSIGN